TMITENQDLKNTHNSMLNKDQENEAQSMLEDNDKDIVDTCMICGCNTHRSAFDNGSEGPTKTICSSCFEAYRK
ncbi:MAG: hypothetical protein ACR2QF_03550, partial [Geminicoccaceae bacterium]